MPIYNLEPNNRVTINDPESGIFGDYLTGTFSIPFDVFEVAPEEMIEIIENNIKSNRFSEEKFNEYLDESLNEKYTGKYRMYVRATLYREG